ASEERIGRDRVRRILAGCCLPGCQGRAVSASSPETTCLADERVRPADEEVIIIRGEIHECRSASGDGIHLARARARLRVEKDVVAHIEDWVAGVNGQTVGWELRSVADSGHRNGIEIDLCGRSGATAGDNAG